MSEWTSNTRACFEGCVGKKIVGVLFDALPINRADLRRGSKTLVFEDGTGLTISSSGSFWRERSDDVKCAVEVVERELRQTEDNLRGVLDLAGRLG